MPLLTVNGVSHSYGSHVILDDVTLSVEPAEKIGLVGRNGCGKTTLMKVIQGSIKPDRGIVALSRGSRAGYLSQDPSLDPNETLRDAAEGAFDELHRLHLELHHVFDAMAGADEQGLDRLLKKQAELESAIATAGGYAIDHRIDATLHGLGFTDDQFALKVGVLSGGQKGRLGLARLLLESPDLLLLDEPTNHLDIAGREWLESFLADEYTGAVLVVSHDRWMLDRVVDRIIEVDRGSIRDYPGNYHAFVELKRERQLTESRVYEKQLDRVRSEEQYIARYKAGQRAKQARGRATRLERFKRDELGERPIELEVMNLRLPKVERTGDLVVVAEGLTKAYDGRTLFKGLDLIIKRGERVGVIGPNGAGKTTLVRCILGEIEPDAGEVRLGSRVNAGYYRQLHDRLDLSLCVWEYIRSVMVGPDGEPKANEQQARDLAGAFLFSGQEQDKVLADMSGGERSRAVIAGLVGSSHNVLVLDEPTNHLDIPSAERLERALSRDGGYEGTLIVISHDRALLESTCDQLVVLDGAGRAEVFPGRYSEWAEKRRQTTEPMVVQSAPGRAPSGGGRQRRRQAAEERERRRDDVSALSMAKLEAKIEELQSRMREIDALMVRPDVYTDGRRCRELQQERDRLAAGLEPLEFEWSRRADEES